MSSIHYKFRAELDYKTLQFDGLHIRGEQLVREICAKENLKLELFELQLQNAHTKKMYTDDELIPRNSSIIVQRSPRKDAAKVQKVQAGVNSGMVNQGDASSSSFDPSVHIGSAEFENMDEAERLNHIRDQSTRAYDPSNFRRRPQGGIMTGPPPPTYTCNRCYQPGHWYKNCPMLNTKRTTGIPSQELMETTADDPAAMLHPSGKYVVPIMHWKARQDTLAKKLEDGSSSPAQADRKVPPELLCPLCQSLFKEAIVTSCCGNSYCAECIEQRIIDPENRKCPGADCGRDLSITSIIPNKTLRDAAAAWLSASAPGQPSAQGIQEPEQIRIRIGLKAPASSNAISSQQLASGISPGSALVSQQPAPSVAVSTVPPSQAAIAAPGLPSSSTPTTASVVQDVSLPPPRLHHELPPGIPGVTSLPHFPQAIPGIPNTVVPQTQSVSLSYGFSIASYTAGFPPAASSGPRLPTINDEWNAFLQTKDRHDKRRDKDRPRHKDRHDSRSRRRRFTKRYRDSSSSSSSSSATSYSDEEERQRRRRREKESSKKRRSVEKERQRRDDHRRERDREREREYRDHRDHREHRDSRDARSSARSKDTKVSASSSSHRRDRDEERRRDRKRDDGRKKDREEKTEEDTRERANKDVESKDEDEIDGIIAEYGNAPAPETVEETRVTEEKENLKDEESSTAHGENTTSPVSKAVDEDEPAADEEPVDEENSIPSREKLLDSVNQAMETSEAEVAETKEEEMPLEEEEDDEEMEADVELKENNEKEDEETDTKEKESQSSTMNTADEDDGGGKKSRRHKKSKKSKKHHRKEEDGDDEDEETRRKKHKKHKKEKKSKKDRRDADSDQEDDRIHRKKERDSDRKYDDEDDSDRKERKKEKNRTESYSTTDRSDRSKEKKEDKVDDRKEKKKESDRRQEEDEKKKERKRDREQEEYDNDKLQAPKIKVKRDEKNKDDRKESDREKDRKKEDLEKEKRKEREERDKKREKEKEREREKERAKEKEKEKEREKEKEKEKERLKEKEKEAEKEQKEKEREKNKEKERKEKAKEIVPEKRRSVHERLQRADTVKVTSSSSSKTVSTLGRKPVSFTVTASKPASNIRVRQYSSSSSTKEQEEEDRSKQDRRKKDETDVESVGDKEKKKKSSRQLSSSGPTVSMHKNTKIKFDL